MKIYQSRSFEKKVKKMSKPEKDSLDREIRRLAEDPSIGEEKKAICEEYSYTNSISKQPSTCSHIGKLTRIWNLS